jgi:hypothetical protein
MLARRRSPTTSPKRSMRHRRSLDDLADPQTTRPHRLPTSEAAAQQPDPLRSRPTERDMANRHHALASLRREARGDPEHDRRPLTPVPRLPRVHENQSSRRRGRLPQDPRACTDCQRRCSATTAPCSPPHHARARCSYKQNSSDSGSPARTPGHTTPKPAERSSAYTKHSSATSPARSPPGASLSYKPSSTRSSTTTTTFAPTERSTAAHHYRPTTHEPRPDPQALERSQQPISAYAKTKSTRQAESRSATTAAYTTSASAEHTQDKRSSSSSPTKTSASPTQTPASSSANSPSTPTATTNQSTTPEPSTITRDTRPGCPETQQNGEGGIRTLDGV